MEFTEQFQGVIDASYHFEILVNVLLQLSLHGTDINIELHEVSVECVIVVVKQLMVLVFECFHVPFECLKDTSDILQVVLFQSAELLDSAEQLNEFRDSPTE